MLIRCCVVFLLFMGVLKAKAQKISFSEKRSSFYNYIKGEDFEGLVFSENFVFPFLSNPSGDKRFTPSNADIELAEQLLVKNIKLLNALKLNQGAENGPIIHDNLKKFARQYYGYFNESAERIVFISCLLKANYNTVATSEPNWLKGAVVVLKGGSNYWQVQANITQSTLFGLEINGLDNDPKH